jgi:hypothetical protein
MQYFRNTNQIQTVGLNKPIGQREECYYGFVTNNSYINSPIYIPSNPQTVLWKWFPCDNPTEDALLLGCGGANQCAEPSGSIFEYSFGPTASIECMSSTRFTIPPPSRPVGDGGRTNQLFFSPFTCETQFTQSMTNYEYVTFTALGVGSGSSGVKDCNNPFVLASYIPSGSTQYTYRLIQLIANDQYPGFSPCGPEPGTPVLGPIAIVSGSAYYSEGYFAPKGNDYTNQRIVYTPYP